MHQHVIQQPARAVVHERLHVLARGETPGLPLHVGKRAHEQRGTLRRADRIHHAGHEQVRDDGREQRARAQNDEVGLADSLERRLVGHHLVRGAQAHPLERRARMAGHGLPLEGAAVARASRERHAIERGGIHVPPRIQQPLADGDGLGKRPGRILERRQHEVAQRVVASEREAVLERVGQRVVRVRSHCGDALAHVARRRDVGFLAQDAGGAAVVGHGDDGARIQSHGQKRAYGHGRAGAAADDDDAQALVARDDGLRFAQCGERRRSRGVVGERTGNHGRSPTGLQQRRSAPRRRRPRPATGRGARCSRGSPSP